MGEYHSYRPEQGHRLLHDPINAIVAPRPIGWISTTDPSGIRNLAPYSYFNLFSDDPPIIGFSSIGRKHTLANIEASGEFVWNLVTDATVHAMNATSATFPAGEDEFTACEIESRPSTLVRPDRVAEAPVAFECKLSQIMQLRRHTGEPLERWLVTGEVVLIHIASALVEEGAYSTATAGPVLRAGGGGQYFSLEGAREFQLRRPSRGTSDLCALRAGYSAPKAEYK